MTRETKIGLLVGLAFIIVIGILLSDYNRIENTQAPLTAVGDNVRGGANTPHNGSTDNAVVLPPAPVMPQHPVPTREELADSHTDVHIGPGNGGTLPPVRPTPRTNNDDAANPDNERTAQNPPTDNHTDSPIERIARDNREPLVPVPPRNNGQDHSPVPPTTDDHPATGPRQYTAEAGDSVSRMALKLMGANTKTNREAIIAANATLKQNPNNVIVGKAYTIPAAKPAAPTATADNTPRPTPPAAAPANSTPQYWYTVKENDSLWKIAAEQLGDGNAYAAIKDLNRDVLKGHDDVRPNMRLRLPAKPVASAN
ncbi:MAG TPA: LysM peptidoglycan-binding domain-containing protein [Tepidisphaeraceae bacterium]|jgi:nucleoid-associated protein YgaU|nr:LysM peptidoglycan-binding domain-containing protein [Tepidisphaeraceae bacterium]